MRSSLDERPFACRTLGANRATFAASESRCKRPFDIIIALLGVRTRSGADNRSADSNPRRRSTRRRPCLGRRAWCDTGRVGATRAPTREGFAMGRHILTIVPHGRLISSHRDIGRLWARRAIHRRTARINLATVPS